MNIFDLFAKLTLDTDDFEKNIGSAEKKAGSFASKLKSGLATAGKVAAAGLAAAGTVAVALGKNAIKAYADYEQLVGGVETLFKGSANLVQRYAANAYKTAGLSANEYMETVTSFSASLLQSLGGDTEQAAKVADMAISDMSDNANKMGSSMESIQAAYQGFAKGQYQLLDNLKLGYGGTKTEMERLLADATALSGVEYDIESLSDVYEAIHVIQTELDITGTTAKEASSTISGSLASMKSSWRNLVIGVADENADFETLIGNFTESVGTAAENILPRISVALRGVGKLVEGLAPVIAKAVPSLIQNVLPTLLRSAATLLMTFGDALIKNLPMLINVALQLAMALADGLVEAIPVLIPAIVDVITVIAKKLTDPETVTMLLDAVIKVAVALVEGLIAALPELMAGLSAIGENLWIILSNAMTPIIEWIKGLWNEVTKWFDDNVIQPVVGFFRGLGESISGFFSDAWASIKGVWSSVSTWFRTNITQPIGNFFSDAWNGLKKGAKDAWEGIKNVFKSIPNWFKEKFKSAWEAVKNVFSAGGRIFTGIKEGIVSAFKTVVNAIITGINKVVAIPFNGINWALGKIRDVSILGIEPFSWIKLLNVPQIPLLARGGIVSNPTLAMIGENGREAIVPLENNTEWIRNVASEMTNELKSSTNSVLTDIQNTLHDILANMGVDIVLSDGAIAGRVDKLLGQTAMRKLRGNA